MNKFKNKIILGIAAAALVGCASSSFVSQAQKSIYSATTLADGAMRSYAVYWKDATNRLGDTAALELQRSNVMVVAFKVGTSINLADQAIASYGSNVGTNQTTQAVISALVATAIQNAANISGEISALTGDTNWANLGTSPPQR